MGEMYRIEPAVSSFFDELEADSPEEALETFTDTMDSDMRAYFKAVLVPKNTEFDELLDIFRRNSAYDEKDEATFRSNDPVFKAKMKELLEEKDDFEDIFEWEVRVTARVIEILNLCQYGDTSDTDDLEKIRCDLMERGFPGRCRKL